MVRIVNEVYFSPNKIFGVIDFDYSPPDEKTKKQEYNL
jgi:hypothetical protein